ncbi:enoyl-CoA hydratase/isomerase family protein [Pseudonocardia spinosispora]|uniref:enoyl-CoA hydratase/isomerase family protein n=1 Tax=Pseudonocardia spinosispora TaxID=103441 RepID=UPI00040D8DC3|nr:enoyl-CoA hydratase/isomerase family protein [Pseudonocardia spinosispora]
MSVVVEVTGPVARVLIDRAGAMNSLSPEVLTGMHTAIDTARDAGCSVFVLRGAGGTLSAGADLKYLRTILADPKAVESYLVDIGAMIDALEAAPFVTVAVVQGYALAGGCEILLGCDLAMVSAEARIGDRHLEYGLLPGAGGSVRLPRALPAALARRLLYTGEMIDGATAFEWGLVSHVAPPDRLDAELDALVARLSRHSTDALRTMKRLYRGSVDTPMAAALAAERAVLVEHLCESASVAEGLAAFGSGRAPDFQTKGTR